MARPEVLKTVLRTAAPAVIAVVLVGGFFVTQHFRHGWPFSLHHGFGPAAAGVTGTPVRATDPHAAHARAPVDLDPNRLATFGIRMEPALNGRPGLIAVFSADSP